MPELLSKEEFTQYLVDQLKPLEITTAIPEPLVVELHYGEEEPVLAIPLNQVYEIYSQSPDQLNDLLNPYLTEIAWTVQLPRYKARQIFEKTLPLMKDLLQEPIAQDGETTILDGQEITLKLPKGPVLYQELIDKVEEHLVVQFIMDLDGDTIELHRGDVLTCFPEPAQIATIAIQNLGKRALEAGLTTRTFKVENFQTEPLLIGFRDQTLTDFVASLVNVSDIMKALEKNIEAQDGMLVIIPSREQLLVSKEVDDQAVCEMWLLAKHLKAESKAPVSGLIWRFKEGQIAAVQTVNLKEEA